MGPIVSGLGHSVAWLAKRSMIKATLAKQATTTKENAALLKWQASKRSKEKETVEIAEQMDVMRGFFCLFVCVSTFSALVAWAERFKLCNTMQLTEQTNKRTHTSHPSVTIQIIKSILNPETYLGMERNTREREI